MTSKEVIRNRKIRNDLEVQNQHKEEEKISNENLEKEKLIPKNNIPNVLPDKSSYYLTRIVLLRFLAFIYGRNLIEIFERLIL